MRLRKAISPLVVVFSLYFSPADMGLAHQSPIKSVERREVQVPIEDFTLVDQNAHEATFRQLAGRVVVVAFAYTTCPDVCPLITAALRRVQVGLSPAERKKVFLLTITTDPEIDSPTVLANYGKRYRADFTNWSFLTGDQAALKKVWKNFGVGVNRKGRGLVDHTPLTALVDHQGKMRVGYVGPSPDANLVLRDVRRLLAQ
jgi:cytochrome oxidase Cu insertion factor (SCO1/SenC/PrrC family)